ncbi:ATP-binding cassette domain-containing protein [Pseudonocardia benzenivorans]
MSGYGIRSPNTRCHDRAPERQQVVPGARALTDVSVTFRPGRVHALVGENGAGKSTLIKVASGVLQPDSGEIRVDGRPVRLTPRDARELQIRVLHQERQVALTRSVADNVVLGEAPATGSGSRASGSSSARRGGGCSGSASSSTCEHPSRRSRSRNASCSSWPVPSPSRRAA